MSQITLQRSLLGQSSLASAQALLSAAVEHWDDTQAADQYIQQALATESSLDVLISAYRYYFYKSNAVMALQMAIAVCQYIQQLEHWPSDWAELKPILVSQIEMQSARLYVSAYAASGLLQARLGDLALAETIANQVQQLQAKEFGADTLLGILNSPAEDEDD
mgnify:FL=1